MKRSWSGFVTSLAFDVSCFTTATTATAALASNVASERTYTSRDDELELSHAHKTLRETQNIPSTPTNCDCNCALLPFIDVLW